MEKVRIAAAPFTISQVLPDHAWTAKKIVPSVRADFVFMCWAPKHAFATGVWVRDVSVNMRNFVSLMFVSASIDKTTC